MARKQCCVAAQHPKKTSRPRGLTNQKNDAANGRHTAATSSNKKQKSQLALNDVIGRD